MDKYYKEKWYVWSHLRSQEFNSWEVEAISVLFHKFNKVTWQCFLQVIWRYFNGLSFWVNFSSDQVILNKQMNNNLVDFFFVHSFHYWLVKAWINCYTAGFKSDLFLFNLILAVSRRLSNHYAINKVCILFFHWVSFRRPSQILHR